MDIRNRTAAARRHGDTCAAGQCQLDAASNHSHPALLSGRLDAELIVNWIVLIVASPRPLAERWLVCTEV